MSKIAIMVENDLYTSLQDSARFSKILQDLEIGKRLPLFLLHTLKKTKSSENLVTEKDNELAISGDVKITKTMGCCSNA